MRENIQSELPEDHSISDVDVLAGEKKTNLIPANDAIIRQNKTEALHEQEEENINKVIESLKK